MKNLISGTLSVLMLSVLAVPAGYAQTGGNTAGQDSADPNTTDVSRPGSRNQDATTNDPDVGNSRDRIYNDTYQNPDTMRNSGDQREMQNRPGRAGDTDQGIPGVTNQNTPGDPDGGTANQSSEQQRLNPGSINTPNNQQSPYYRQGGQNTITPDAGNRPGMPGGTDQGIPGVTNQSVPGDPDGGTSNQSVEQQRLNPGSINTPNSQYNAPGVNTQGSLGTSQSVSQYVLTPFDVVNLAARGYLEGAGIPSAARLRAEYLNRSITAEDIVRAAVSQNRIAASTVDDTGFVNSVRTHMHGLFDHLNDQ